MLTISKPLSAGQARAYHAEEFGNARENYYTEAEQIRGEWHGRLGEQWGLHGEVREEQFQRLSEGQHPITGEQHQVPSSQRIHEQAWRKRERDGTPRGMGRHVFSPKECFVDRTGRWR